MLNTSEYAEQLRSIQLIDSSIEWVLMDRTGILRDVDWIRNQYRRVVNLHWKKRGLIMSFIAL